ncbi:MAG: hypothetical protein PW788_07355 [Micavibrio sp.]|nr:hypothetical protein [Micavibrio sp.]
MTEWTPKVEQLIRDVGDYLEAQMKDLIDPAAGALGTSSRMAFRHASNGQRLMDRAANELGCNLSDWNGSLQKVVELAEANNSDAAAKIKRVLPLAKRIADEFGIGEQSAGMGKLEQFQKLKQVKKKGYRL